MKKRVTKSLRIAIPAVFIALIVLVSGILIVFSTQLGGQVRQQTEQNMSSMLRAVSITLADEIEQLENYLADISTDYTLFRSLGSAQDMTRVYAAAEEIDQTFAPIVGTNSAVTALLVYSANVDMFHAAYGQLYGESGAERVRLKSGIRQALPPMLLGGGLPLNEWAVVTVEGRLFLARAVSWREVYCACLLDLEMLTDRLEQKYAIDGQLVFAQEGRVLVSDDSYTGLDLPAYVAQVAGDRPVLTVQDNIGPVDIICIVTYDTVLRLSMLQGLLLFLSLLAIIALPLLYRYLHKSFIRPMNELVHSMELIQAGNMEARPSDKYSSVEFQQVNDTFTSMLEQISHLKIESYERQLAAERNEMIALKMQIKPHFFLNSMKSLYALAGTGNIGEVQSRILLLSNHLRYVLSFRADTVALETELALCENYVALHGAGRALPTVCQLDMDDRLKSLQVPIMSVLTLVENCVKHGDVPGKRLVVRLDAHILHMDDGELANITIRDNGHGFDEKQLGTLNQALPETQEDSGHVGIDNVMRRFRFLYGEGFAAAFSGTDGVGAQIDLYIPLQETEAQDA